MKSLRGSLVWMEAAPPGAGSAFYSPGWRHWSAAALGSRRQHAPATSLLVLTSSGKLNISKCSFSWHPLCVVARAWSWLKREALSVLTAHTLNLRLWGNLTVCLTWPRVLCPPSFFHLHHLWAFKYQVCTDNLQIFIFSQTLTQTQIFIPTDFRAASPASLNSTSNAVSQTKLLVSLKPALHSWQTMAASYFKAQSKSLGVILDSPLLHSHAVHQ